MDSANIKTPKAHEGTLLVIDDDRSHTDAVRYFLNDKPFTLFTASDGASGLALAEEKKPDIVLLDIIMPEMDGFEVLRRLRKNEATKDLLVVILTGERRDSNSIEVAFALGANEFLSKPIDTEELLIRVRALLRLRKAEQEAERLRRDYFSMIIHDLRGPLTSLKMMAEMILLDDPKTGEAEHAAGTMVKETSEHLLSLVNNALEISSWESISYELWKEPASLKALVMESYGDLAALSKQKKIAFSFEFDPALPSLPLDPMKFRQVITNLFHNAIKFSPENSGVHVRTWQTGERIMMSIADTGVGIPKSQLPDLFTAYKSVTRSKRSLNEGTGLGLAICKNIVEAHGGTIKADSTEGKGATFVISLPKG